MWKMLKMAPKILAASLAASTGVMAATTAQAAASLLAVPAGGNAPLVVSFSGHGGGATFFGGIVIDFGDGTVAAVCSPGAACRQLTVQHTYVNSGIFTARLLGTGEGSRTVLAEAVVTIN